MQPEMFPSPGRLPSQILTQLLLLKGTKRLDRSPYKIAPFHSGICVCLLSKPSGPSVEDLFLILLSTVALFDGGFPCDRDGKRKIHFQTWDKWCYKSIGASNSATRKRILRRWTSFYFIAASANSFRIIKTVIVSVMHKLNNRIQLSIQFGIEVYNECAQYEQIR